MRSLRLRSRRRRGGASGGVSLWLVDMGRSCGCRRPLTIGDHPERSQGRAPMWIGARPWDHRRTVSRTEQRRLYRSTDDRVIAGVCGGLAQHLDMDVRVVRIAFVVLAFVGGTGLILYAAF